MFFQSLDCAFPSDTLLIGNIIARIQNKSLINASRVFQKIFFIIYSLNLHHNLHVRSIQKAFDSFSSSIGFSMKVDNTTSAVHAMRHKFTKMLFRLQYMMKYLLFFYYFTLTNTRFQIYIILFKLHWIICFSVYEMLEHFYFQH